MSAWPIPDEVVETVLVKLGYDPAVDTGVYGVVRAALERHRLVVLPEEPNAHQWEDEAGGWTTEDCDEEGARIEAGAWPSTGRIRPAYVIPGQPITVDKEERDGE